MPYCQLLLLLASSLLDIPIILAWWNIGYGAKAATGSTLPYRKHILLDKGVDDCAFPTTCTSQENYRHLLLLSCTHHHLQAVLNHGGYR